MGRLVRNHLATLAVLLASVMVATPGCLRPEEPSIDFRVVLIQQRATTEAETSRGVPPQVTYNITMNLTNVGTIWYEFDDDDWAFMTDTGLAVSISGFVAMGDSPSSRFREGLQPGESGEWKFRAHQVGATHGNLTAVSFRGGMPKPV